MRQEPETAALGALYAGLARGVRARLYTLRGERMNSASEGKRMRADLLEAVAQDPGLASDADAAAGTKCTGSNDDFSGNTTDCAAGTGTELCYDVKP